jgi:hypothetical protein
MPKKPFHGNQTNEGLSIYVTPSLYSRIFTTVAKRGLVDVLNQDGGDSKITMINTALHLLKFTDDQFEVKNIFVKISDPYTETHTKKIYGINGMCLFAFIQKTYVDITKTTRTAHKDKIREICATTRKEIPDNLKHIKGGSFERLLIKIKDESFLQALDEKLKKADQLFIGDEGERIVISQKSGIPFVNPFFNYGNNKDKTIYDTFNNSYAIATYGNFPSDPYEQYLKVDSEKGLDLIMSTIIKIITDNGHKQKGDIVIFPKGKASKDFKEYTITYYDQNDFDFLKKRLPESLATCYNNASEKCSIAASTQTIFNKNAGGDVASPITSNGAVPTFVR